MAAVATKTAGRNGGSFQYELTWFDARNCWKKKHSGGKVWYSAKCPGGKTDRKAYEAALGEWREFQGTLNPFADRTEGVFAGTEDGMTPADAREHDTALAQREDYQTATAGMVTPPSFGQWKEDVAALERGHRVRRDEKVDPSETVEKRAEAFLVFKTAQATTAQRSSGRVINLRTYVNQFRDFAGKEKAAAAVNWGLVLSDYYAKQMTEISGGKVGEYGARDRMQVAKQFIKYLYKQHAIEHLPRNIDDKEMTIECEAEAIDLPALKTVKAWLNVIPETVTVVGGAVYPLLLYVLLALNCGMTSKDVSDLKQSEVDWDNGFITRKRSKKTRKTKKKIPTVTYKLWGKTFELLKKYRSANETYVLINQHGGRLVTKALTADGKGSSTDLVADRWNGFIDSHADFKDAPSFKYMRKISSSEFDNETEFSRYAVYFLCQAPKGTAAKFYTVPSQDRFDAALAWLGNRLGL